MKEIETPSKTSKNLEQKAFQSINNDEKFKKFINKINQEYLFWDKVKYHKYLDKSPKFIWAAVTVSRNINYSNIKFGKNIFKYNLTAQIQELLYKFDINFKKLYETEQSQLNDTKEQLIRNTFMNEAIASSQIEGAVTTRRIAKNLLRKNIKPKNKSEQMILNNYNTIKYIVKNKNEEISNTNLLEIHKLITNNTLENNEQEGAYRTNNEIHIVDVIDGEITHTPPAYQEIPEILNELFIFFNNENYIHPIIKASIIHFMIGFTHPFADGNGRTARALFYWFLLKNKYKLIEYLSISELINQSKTQYAKAFIYTEIDNFDLTYFINFNIKIIEKSFNKLIDYIEKIKREKYEILKFNKIENINNRQATIISWINIDAFKNINVKEVETRLNVSNQSARTDLQGLVSSGFLEIVNIDKKSKIYIKSKNFSKLLQIQLNK